MRECFLNDVDGDGAVLRTLYRADYDKSILGKGWKPSIHMPRWASRITLEVAGVRVERVQDITDADALAEGCIGKRQLMHVETEATHRSSFSVLWDSINAARGYSWASNPWVWVVAFRRVEK